ncbi:hypothetical protein [Desulfosporosinus nitroreducens]|uniref:hypothetical protein n=1 Tax=Desulfosporosinus nitroreducens TaxID=2018668 RepID=UPI00207CA724|nr:hypothetical protein [Desulfosporosinus nitroreducens]MCO1600954.1 hypothetical protein [Desulfosporosinus nitroreducens]
MKKILLMVVLAMSLLLAASPAMAATAITYDGIYRGVAIPNYCQFYGANNWSQPAYFDLTTNSSIPNGATVVQMAVYWTQNYPYADMVVGFFNTSSSNGYQIYSGTPFYDYAGKLVKQKWYVKAGAKYSGSITGINIVLYWNNPAGMSGITTVTPDGSSSTQVIQDGTPSTTASNEISATEPVPAGDATPVPVK